MSSKKATRREDVSIEYKGQTYNGYRIIEGTKKLSQWVHYGMKCKYDGHGYRPDEGAYMRGIAEMILRELVQEELGRQSKEQEE